MAVLITGGTGVIGAEVARLLLDQGEERIALTQGSISFVPSGARGEGLAGWTWEVADPPSVRKAARDQGIAVDRDRIALFGADVTLAER